VIREGKQINPHRGATREILGHDFVIENPIDRCILSQSYSFNIFRAFGHWLWIMAGKMDLPSIEYYAKQVGNLSADQRKLDGAYGPRLFGLGVLNQVPNLISSMQHRGATRRAVATVYIPEFDSHRVTVEGREDEVPCTVALQFLPRDGHLHSVTMMRSQDVFKILPYDVFIFTLIQEYVARSLGLELGEYHHFASSFHVYEADIERANRFISDPTPPGHAMPTMPPGAQDEFLKRVQRLEESIRIDAISRTDAPGATKFRPARFVAAAERLPPFWRDVVLCLVVWSALQDQSTDVIRSLHEKVDPAFKIYVERALVIASPKRVLERYYTGANSQ